MTLFCESEKRPLCLYGGDCYFCGEELITEHLECPNGCPLDYRYDEAIKKLHGNGNGGHRIRYQSHEGSL